MAPVTPTPPVPPKVVVTTPEASIPVRMDHVKSALKDCALSSPDRFTTEYTKQLDDQTTAVYCVHVSDRRMVNQLTVRLESTSPSNFTYPPANLSQRAIAERDKAIELFQAEASEHTVQ